MENKPSSARIAIKWGLVLAVLSSIWTTIFYMADLWKNSYMSFASMVLIVIVLVMAFKEYKSSNGGFMSLGSALGLGSLLGTVSGLITSLYALVYTQFIDPTYLSRFINFQEEKMINDGLPEEAIEMSLGWIEKSQTGGIAFLIGIVGSLVVAFILSLIIGAIMQKKKPLF